MQSSVKPLPTVSVDDLKRYRDYLLQAKFWFQNAARNASDIAHRAQYSLVSGDMRQAVEDIEQFIEGRPETTPGNSKRRVRIKATPTTGRDLHPGDLFSIAGPEYWDMVDATRSIGERVYVRMNTPAEESPDLDEQVYRIEVER